MKDPQTLYRPQRSLLLPLKCSQPFWPFFGSWCYSIVENNLCSLLHQECLEMQKLITELDCSQGTSSYTLVPVSKTSHGIVKWAGVVSEASLVSVLRGFPLETRWWSPAHPLALSMVMITWCPDGHHAVCNAYGLNWAHTDNTYLKQVLQFWRSVVFSCAVMKFAVFLHACWEFTSNMRIFSSTKYFKPCVEHSCIPPIPTGLLYKKNGKQTDAGNLKKKKIQLLIT